MVIAQFSCLPVPIVVALSHRAMEGIWRDYGDDLLVSSASRLQPYLISCPLDGWKPLTASLAGFGRSISEVGAILIVGGNIAGYTRTMTTAIMLETSEGYLGFALALGLVLVAISIAVNACAFAIEGRVRHIIPRRPRKPFVLFTTLQCWARCHSSLRIQSRTSGADSQTIVLASTTSVRK